MRRTAISIPKGSRPPAGPTSAAPALRGVSASTTADAPPDRSAPSSEQRIYANGVVEGRQRELSLQFEITGRLLSIEVEEGDQVRRGDLLASLDPSALNADLSRAEAALARAQAELDLLLAGAREEVRENFRAQCRLAHAELVRASRHHERTAQLNKDRVSTGQELDDARAAFEATQARYEAALAKVQEVEAPARAEEVRIAHAKIAMEQANIRAARTTLDRTHLRAPLDGLVLQCRGEPGELVGPESELPIVTMADASDLSVRAFVEEMDAPRVALGDAAVVWTDGVAGRQFHGQVVSCAPYMTPKRQLRNRPNERVDVKTREVLIRLDAADQRDRLMVGLSVDVSIQPAMGDHWN